jgi:hypothetical protein
MIDRGRGDVVLISPALVGGSSATADRMLEIWVAGLDAEFVGTGVRVSIVRSTAGATMPPGDVGCLIAAAISSRRRMHLRVVDVIPPVLAPTLAKERKSR